MRWTPLLILSLCPLLIFAPPARAESWSELLAQAKAADELGAALTNAGDRATREADAMTRYLRDAGQPATFTTPPRPKPRTTYRELFDRAVARAKKAGDAGGAVGDDSLFRNLTAAQLFDEMTALQVYNIS